MATTQTRPYITGNADIKLEYGTPQTFALKFAEGKSVESRFPGGRVMFTALDDRKLFLDDEDANDLERAMRDLGLGVADFMKVTKIRHARGGGHSIRVERVEEGRDPDGDRDNAPAWVRDAAPAPRQTREEALLEKSIELARERGAAAFQRTPARVSPEPPPAPAQTATNNGDHSVRAHQLKGSFLAAIDAIAEAQKYADAQGLKVTFTSDDVRAAAISVFIQAEKAAMGARY